MISGILWLPLWSFLWAMTSLNRLMTYFAKMWTDKRLFMWVKLSSTMLSHLKKNAFIKVVFIWMVFPYRCKVGSLLKTIVQYLAFPWTRLCIKIFNINSWMTSTIHIIIFRFESVPGSTLRTKNKMINVQLSLILLAAFIY